MTTNNNLTVHKQTVLASRLAFALWANKNNKQQVLRQLQQQEVNIDEIAGERVPLAIVTEEIQAAARLSQEPQLGLKILDLIDIRITSLYQAVQQALQGIGRQNIHLPAAMLLRLIVRYFHILSEVVELELQYQQDSLVVLFTPRNPDNHSYHQIEGAVYGLIKLVRELNQTEPEAIYFAHVPDSIDSDLYQQCLKLTPEFNSRTTRLVYRAEKQTAQNTLPVLLNPLINLHDKNFPHMDYAQRCELLLQAILGFVEPNRETIASILNLSISTLQRRLKESGTNFNDVLLKVRKQMVQEYLKNPQLTAEQLAFLLGYKAKSQFLKAFRQWFGQTPQEYRQLQN